MFSRILVPLDGSALAEQALPVAARIARATGAHMLLVRAIAVPMTYGVMYEGESLRWRMIHEETDAARAYLRQVARSASLEEISGDVITAVGPAADVILDAVAQRKADLVVMTSHGRTGLGRWVLGSVAEHVVHHAPAPVLVLRGRDGRDAGTADLAGGSGDGPPRLLVPLDGSPLAEAVLEPAGALALALAASGPAAIHLTLVIAPYEAVRTNMPDALIVDGAKAYLERVARQMAAGADEGRLTVTWSVDVNGDLAHGILSVAEGTAKAAATAEHAAAANPTGEYDMIAMATHGYGAMARWALGSVTERVLHASHLPMLIVRPAEMAERIHDNA